MKHPSWRAAFAVTVIGSALAWRARGNASLQKAR
jgi:hypothetical protein